MSIQSVTCLLLLSIMRFLGDLRWVTRFGSFWKKWAKSMQAKSNHLQTGSSKICVQYFHGQDEDWFRIFWALLVHFGLGTMLQKAIWKVQCFGFKRTKSSNLEVWKTWGVEVEIGPYLWRYKYFVKEAYWWIVVYCMGVWEVAFNFWFLKMFMWFLGGVKCHIFESVQMVIWARVVFICV